MLLSFQWKPLIKNILIAEGVGSLSGLLTMGSMQKFIELQKPPYAPSGWVFPVVWSILFLLMGISAYLVEVGDSGQKEKNWALGFYYLQLSVNFFWSIIFFNMGMRFFAFIWILLLIGLVLITKFLFTGINKWAGALLYPYLLWISFAAVLNWGVYQLNK